MRCTFCATGKGGFARNLQAHEIVDQVLTIQEAFGERVSNVGALLMPFVLLAFSTDSILLRPAPVHLLHKCVVVSRYNRKRKVLIRNSTSILQSCACTTHRERFASTQSMPASFDFASLLCSLHGYGRAAAQSQSGCERHRPAARPPRHCSTQDLGVHSGRPQSNPEACDAQAAVQARSIAPRAKPAAARAACSISEEL